jgi:hypothetical protein
MICLSYYLRSFLLGSLYFLKLLPFKIYDQLFLHVIFWTLFTNIFSQSGVRVMLFEIAFILLNILIIIELYFSLFSFVASGLGRC